MRLLIRIYKHHRRSNYNNYSLFSHNSPIQTLISPQLHNHDGNPSYKIQKRCHVGHSHHHHHEEEQRSSKEGEKIFRLGLAADIGLAAGKAFVGYVSGSTAITADAAHSVSDVVLSGVALVSFKAARVPKDKEHPYGRF